MEFNPISFFWHSEDLLRCLCDHVITPLLSPSSALTFRPWQQVVVSCGTAEPHWDRPRRFLVDKSNLSVLCRVNRVCQLVFTQALNRHITLIDHPSGPGFSSLRLLRLLAENASVAHTQTLTIGSYQSRWEALDHQAARRLLSRFPSLRRFDCFGVPLEASTAAALVNSCGRLSAVHIDFPVSEADRIDVDADGNRDGVVLHLGNLTGLRELCLDHMYGHPEQWIGPIARVLIASPGLQKLQLSMSRSAVTFHLARREADLTPFKTFLLRICTLFKASGASPLRLRSFRCGSGVHPDFPPGSPCAITDLICLGDLETVYLNTGIGVPATIAPTVLVAGTDRHIPISPLVHDTPRLRRFSVSRYDGLVHDALSALDADRARQLAVTWDVLSTTTALGPNSLVGISSAPKHHFRLFKIEFQRSTRDDVAFDGAAQAGRRVALAEARGIVEGLVEGDGGTLEGLDVVLPLRWREPYVDLLAEMIPGLMGLTQLSIDDEDDFVDFDFWGKAAKKLAVAGRRLRYVERPLDCLEVVRGGEGAVPLLEIMGVMEEMDDAELFSLRRAAAGFVFPDRTDL